MTQRTALASPASADLASLDAKQTASYLLRHAGDNALPWLLPVALLLLWQTGASQGWISPQVLPPPQFVLQILLDLFNSGDLWLHVEASLRRVLLGFFAGSALGLMLGCAMGLSRRIEAYLLPTFNALVSWRGCPSCCCWSALANR